CPPRASVERPIGLTAAHVGGVAALPRTVATHIATGARVLLGVEDLDLRLVGPPGAGDDHLLAELGARAVPRVRRVALQVVPGVGLELDALTLADLGHAQPSSGVQMMACRHAWVIGRNGSVRVCT